MKQILISLIVLAALTGCQEKQKDQAEHDKKVAQQAREELLRELQAEAKAKRKRELEIQQQGKLANIGIITTPDGKIIIDTDKTKSYLEQFAKTVKEKTDRLTADIHRGVVEEKEAGIEINETHIHIDLNKTKNFLEHWAKRMAEFAKEFDTIAQELNKTTY